MLLCSKLSIEGILEGLQIAWQHGYEKIVVQSDSSAAVQLLSPPSADSPFAFVRSIAMLMDRPWFIEFKTICREANTAADFIAKQPAPSDGSAFIFDSFSTPLLDFLHRDIHGPRTIV
ncbi:hypothetical protein F3Y22_tig00110330pilonHSYRG00173 [Hibiscus syriacus]|uniref:RNase H type-1 domain-containing protein n=1 Tax=Hibiscus syriacus TaxID=106335 RepID=A0A6A3B059_HIBSY|nr:hypothetical protein F3Y22_tig00110330pilonHSYRG00173 [Hibiscus syriacus]